MKDLLKQFIEKGYVSTFYWTEYELNTFAEDFIEGKAKKLELYLMRDWLEEKGVIVDVEYTGYSFQYHIFMKFSDELAGSTRIEALTAALTEAIKHIP
jgi:hypothetical protein